MMGHRSTTYWGDKQRRSEFQYENLKGINHLRDFGVDGKIIMNLNLTEVSVCGLCPCYSGYGVMVGSCERKRHFGLHKGGKFPYKLHTLTVLPSGEKSVHTRQ